MPSHRAPNAWGSQPTKSDAISETWPSLAAAEPWFLAQYMIVRGTAKLHRGTNVREVSNKLDLQLRLWHLLLRLDLDYQLVGRLAGDGLHEPRRFGRGVFERHDLDDFVGMRRVLGMFGSQ